MKKTLAFLLLLSSAAYAQKQVDICVYGGNSGGVMAAVAAKRMGKSVVLVEPGKHVGGMTTGGLATPPPIGGGCEHAFPQPPDC